MALVVLVDSGVNIDHPHLRSGRDRIRLGPRFDPCEPPKRSIQDGDLLGHGTCVAAAIRDLAPDARIVSIRIFDDRPVCALDTVAAALEEAAGLRPDLVNLSFGSSSLEAATRLEAGVRSLLAIGARILAPADRFGLPAYPGLLAGVEGVAVDPNLPRGRAERRGREAERLWFASPFPRDLPGIPRERNLFGSSLAVANVTGFLAAGGVAAD